MTDEHRLQMNEDVAVAILSLFQEACAYKIEKLVFIVVASGDNEEEVREYVWGFNDCEEHGVEPIGETDALDIMAAALMGAAMERMTVVPPKAVVTWDDPDHPRHRARDN